MKESEKNIPTDSTSTKKHQFEVLRTIPKNPSHFVALCMRMLRDNPTLATKSGGYVKKVSEVKGRAVFECAYGYFWATVERHCCNSFFPNRESCVADLES